MSEALVFIHDSQPVQEEEKPFLELVPDNAPYPYGSRSYIGPEEDENGKVTRPAMLVEEGIMPNGQPVHVFYDRGVKGADSYGLADRALGRAARILAQIDK